MPYLSAGQLSAMLAAKAEWSARETAVEDLLAAEAADPAFADVSFVIGSEAGNVINVGIQLLNSAGGDLAERGHVRAYLSDDAAGDSLAATAPSAGVAIGTDGLILAEEVADKVFSLVSEADGDIDLDIGEASADTWYLIVILPSGKLAPSGAITFT